VSVICSSVTVEYTGGPYSVRAIEDLDMEVASGELALLLGTSGSGKTTLLSVLAAILRPTAGTVHVDDFELTRARGPALADYRRRKVGIVFQAYNLIPSLNAAENVQVPLRAAGFSGRESRARAEGLLAQFGLTERRDHRPADLSGGQQQRVALARALVLDPPLLLADEPTAHLDYVQIEGLVKLLRQIADEGRTVIVSTHDERLTPLADHVQNLTPAGYEEVSLAREVTLEAGEILFAQGEQGELVYVIEQGEIEIVRTLADGGEELVTRLGPGSYFGELGPMLKMPRTATARAREASLVLGLSGPEFRQRLRAEKMSALAGASEDFFDRRG
jgi:putative ABC transport system ATP-binding protein